jgi:post-segregation antitoxin (ccd killing protein)
MLWVEEGVIQRPIPMAAKRPMKEPMKKTTELSLARDLCAAMRRAKTNISGLKRTTIPIEKAVPIA